MEEAEALSDRIMILKDGSVQCIGDSLSLKEKYAQLYSISISLKENQFNEGYAILEEFVEDREIKLKVYKNTVSFSAQFEMVKAMFKLLSQDLEDIVEDWEFSQPSLDDVFMNLAEKP